MAQDEIKIRSLPRGNEKAADKDSDKANRKDAKDAKKLPRWIIYVGTANAVFLMSLFVIPKPKTIAKPGKTESASVAPRAASKPHDASQGKAPQNSLENSVRQLMAQQKRALESTLPPATDQVVDEQVTLAEPDRNLGVQLDTDKDSDRVYGDLHEDTSEDEADLSPADRINSRLVTRKWVTEVEREQRVRFLKNFVRSAYDQGLEVEIDQNLVVVGVRPVNQVKKLNLEQVIDRLAKQGL